MAPTAVGSTQGRRARAGGTGGGAAAGAAGATGAVGAARAAGAVGAGRSAGPAGAVEAAGAAGTWVCQWGSRKGFVGVSKSSLPRFMIPKRSQNRIYRDKALKTWWAVVTTAARSASVTPKLSRRW